MDSKKVSINPLRPHTESPEQRTDPSGSAFAEVGDVVVKGLARKAEGHSGGCRCSGILFDCEQLLECHSDSALYLSWVSLSLAAMATYSTVSHTPSCRLGFR